MQIHWSCWADFRSRRQNWSRRNDACNIGSHVSGNASRIAASRSSRDIFFQRHMLSGRRQKRQSVPGDAWDRGDRLARRWGEDSRLIRHGPLDWTVGTFGLWGMTHWTQGTDLPTPGTPGSAAVPAAFVQRYGEDSRLMRHGPMDWTVGTFGLWGMTHWTQGTDLPTPGTPGARPSRRHLCSVMARTHDS